MKKKSGFFNLYISYSKFWNTLLNMNLLFLKSGGGLLDLSQQFESEGILIWNLNRIRDFAKMKLLSHVYITILPNFLSAI